MTSYFRKTFLLIAIVVINTLFVFPFLLQQTALKRKENPHYDTEGEEACPIEFKKDERIGEKRKPVINLNPNKFLLPVLINGPNNQLQGLRESIFLAIRLNRTIVMPRFEKHVYQKSKTLYPGHRIDLSLLRRLVPVVTHDDFQRECAGKIDVVFRVRKMALSDYTKLEKIFKIKLFKSFDAETVIKKPWLSDVIEYPLNHTIRFNPKLGGMVLPTDERSLQKLYGAQEPCALLPFPYLSIRFFFPHPKKNTFSHIDLKATASIDLYREIVHHTRAPIHVSQMAANFASTAMGHRPYVAVHWRYDEVDWIKQCFSDKYLPQYRRQMCDDIMSFQPIDIANAINDVLRSRNITINDVYIAYPTTQNNVIRNVIQLLRERFHRNVFTHAEVMSYWNEGYDACDWLRQDRLDILSSTEMELCCQATHFLKSESSSWSSVVWQRRPYDPNDRGQHGIIHLIKTTKATQRNDVNLDGKII